MFVGPIKSKVKLMVSSLESMQRLSESMKIQLKSAERLVTRQKCNVMSLDDGICKQKGMQFLRNMQTSYQHLDELLIQYNSMLEFSNKLDKCEYYTEYISFEFSHEQERLFGLSNLITSLLNKEVLLA